VQTAVGLGTVVTRVAPFSLMPGISWRERVLNALGQPIDGEASLAPGPDAVPADPAPPPGHAPDATRVDARAEEGRPRLRAVAEALQGPSLLMGNLDAGCSRAGALVAFIGA
jgi:hypothetical protein